MTVTIILIVPSFMSFTAHGSKNQGENNDKINMDFNTVDIRLLINFISELTGKNFLVDDGVRGKVTVVCPSPIPKEEAYSVFESILEIKGFSAIPAGNVVKIIKSRNAPQRNIKMRTHTETVNEKKDDTLITQLIPIENTDAGRIAKILRPLLPKYSKLIIYQPTNTIILIDTVSNIDRLIKIIEQVDIAPAEHLFKIIPLEHVSPNTILKQIQSVIQHMNKGSGKSVSRRKRGRRSKNNSSTEPKIISDNRIGALIVLALEEDMEIIGDLVEQLDIPAPRSQDKLKVYSLKNSQAEHIASILTKIAKQQRRHKGKTSRAIAPLIGKTQIVANKSTNSLIIIASSQDHTTLERIIRQLDMMRPQVLIEALIAEVDFHKNQDIGAEWRALDVPEEGDDYKGFGGTNFGQISSVQNLQPPTGMFLGIMRDTITLGGMELPNIAALIRAYQSDNNVNILSTPHILTMDNEEAQLLIGEDVPIKHAEIVDNRTIYSTTYKAVGISLTITPHINPKGYIKLEMGLKVDKVNREAESGIWTTRREAKTIVMLKDKETIIIGGLLQDDKQKGFSRVPCLGEIPVLGRLFRSLNTNRGKTNLQIFISPHIINSPEELKVLPMTKDFFIKKPTEGQDTIM
ncbi:MAG: type II secretion system secretin GspD [bacterium]